MARAETIKKPLKGALDITYLIRFNGTYKAGANGADPSAIKPYDITVKMDHAMLKEHGALSAFKNFIAPEVMPIKYPDYQERGLVTFKVVKYKCSHPEVAQDNIHLLDREALVAFIEENEYPITSDLYEDAEGLRQAIMDYEVDPDGYTKVTEPNRARKHGGKLRLRQIGRQLNSNFDPNFNLGDDEDEDEENVEGMEVKKSGKGKPTKGSALD